MPEVRKHIEVESYMPAWEAEWNSFVFDSKNATFMHDRRYMEHHDDPFVDVSAVVRYKGEPIALFPASARGNVVVSHGGLTYGGVLSNEEMTTPKMLATFDALRDWYDDVGFDSMLYKTIPEIYHREPAHEDLYALFRGGARLYRRDVTSVVPPGGPVGGFRDGRGRSIKGAAGKVMTRDHGDLEAYWGVVEENLEERHDTDPTHSFDEMEYLMSQFPSRIVLHTASYEGEVVAGVILYRTAEVDHCQYIASTEKGRDVGALDLLFDRLIGRDTGKAFDFGISTENDGWYLNEGLIFYKESFGARASVHDFYEVMLP